MRSRLLTLLLALLVSLLLCEIALRTLTRFPVSLTSNLVADPVLGYRLTSELEDVDKLGFRNPPRPRKGLAAIGDSHTYGFNVASENSWPRLLERLTGIRTYNFGVGSYGVYSYHALIHESIDSELDGAIIAIYPPNDFIAGYSYCLQNRDSEFWKAEKKRISLSMPPCKTVFPPYDEPSPTNLIKLLLTEFTAIGSALKHLILEPVRRTVRRRQLLTSKATQRRGDSEAFYVPGANEFVSRARVAGHARQSNINKSSVANIFDDFSIMASDWAHTWRAHHFPIGILVIPSKQRLLVEFAAKNGGNNHAEDLTAYLLRERELEARVTALAESAGLPVVSALPALVRAKSRAMRLNRPLYEIGEGHPGKRGYEAYASAAVDLLHLMCRNEKHKLCEGRFFTPAFEQ